MKKIKSFLIKTVISFFGSGFSKIAPGTCGSLATIPLIIVLSILYTKYNINFAIAFPIFTICLFFVGWYCSYLYMKETNNNDDPQEIVIDEVVGQLISFILTFVVLFFIDIENMQTDFMASKMFVTIAYIVMPFVLFRIYDIKKPLLVGYFDKNYKNAFGTMIDDVVAGIYAGLTDALIIFILSFII